MGLTAVKSMESKNSNGERFSDGKYANNPITGTIFSSTIDEMQGVALRPHKKIQLNSPEKPKSSEAPGPPERSSYSSRSHL